MPKTSEYPGLRTHTRTGKSGAVWISYFYDMRRSGGKDIPLGTNQALAVERWKELVAGSNWKPVRVKRPSARVPGRRRKFADDLWDEIPGWGKRMYLNAESRAATLQRPFVLTVNELANAIRRADGRCEVSGIEFEGEGKPNPFSPSVDRIDSTIGYRADNIRIVCLIVNFAMNTWGEGPLRVLAERLLRNPYAEPRGSSADLSVAATAEWCPGPDSNRDDQKGQGILSPDGNSMKSMT